MVPFQVGDKVVCIADVNADHWPWHYNWGEILPVVGEIYTVRDFDVDYFGPGIRLEEIVNEPMPYEFGGLAEADFAIECFRPVKTTSIDVFLQMLKPTKVNA